MDNDGIVKDLGRVELGEEIKDPSGFLCSMSNTDVFSFSAGKGHDSKQPLPEGSLEGE